MKENEIAKYFKLSLRNAHCFPSVSVYSCLDLGLLFFKILVLKSHNCSIQALFYYGCKMSGLAVR